MKADYQFRRLTKAAGPSCHRVLVIRLTDASNGCLVKVFSIVASWSCDAVVATQVVFCVMALAAMHAAAQPFLPGQNLLATGDAYFYHYTTFHFVTSFRAALRC